MTSANPACSLALSRNDAMAGAPRFAVALPSDDSSTALALARSHGELVLAFKRRADATVIDRLFQSGCLKARFTAPQGRRAGDAILLNTAGGLTGGDRLAISVHWGRGTSALMTGQASEKIYRRSMGVARIATTISLESGAAGEWLPQETILFDRAALDRETAIHLAPDARFLCLEAVVLGRTAMGETVKEGQLREAWRIWRGDKLIYADALELKGPIAHSLQHRAITGGAIAFATLLWIDPDCGARLDDIRAGLAAADGHAGASFWNGMIAIRLLAPDGACLRRDIVRALKILRPERPLPPLWQC